MAIRRSAITSEVALGANVKDFGGIVDGSTDDTAAINAALTSQNDVQLHAGTHKVTGTITLLDGQHLSGVGQSTVIQGAVTGSVIKLGNGGSPGDNQRLGVEKLMITGVNTRAIDLENVQDFFVRDITIGGSYNGATLTDGVRAAQCWDGSISNITTEGSAISNAHFLFGGSFNGTSVDNLYVGGGPADANNVAFLIDSSDSGGAKSSGSGFSNLTAQGCGIGLWVRSVDGGVVNGFYEEQCTRPIVFGDYANSHQAVSFAVNGAVLYSTTSAQPGYANRVAMIDFDLARGCSVNNPDFGGIANIYDKAPLVFSGGGGSGALAIARVTAGGVISSVEVLYGGTGYSTDPTCTCAAATAETLVVTRSGTTVGSVAVSAGGTGVTMTNTFPVAISYQSAIRCVVRSPMFYAGTTFTGHAWLSPIYPLLVRSASGIGYAGVTIEQDFSFKQDGANYSGQTATVQKALLSNIHTILEHDTTGALVFNPYTPPVFP